MANRGVISRYNKQEGYGYISPSTDDSDIFFNESDYPDGVPHEGEDVKYRTGTNDEGHRTIEIISVSGPKLNKDNEAKKPWWKREQYTGPDKPTKPYQNNSTKTGESNNDESENKPSNPFKSSDRNMNDLVKRDK